MISVDPARRAWPFRLAAVYSGVFLLLFARRPDALLNAQFWAEDGPVFFHAALVDGLRSFFEGYAGYIHVVPRLVALIALIFPFNLQPLVYNLASLLIAAGVLTLFAAPAYRYLVHSDIARIAIVLAAAIAPFGGEVIGDITNIQWFLTIGALLLVLYRPTVASASGSVLRALLAACCAFSAPLTILWLPMALRVLSAPRHRERTTALIVIVGSVFEVGLSVVSAQSAHQPFSLHVLATALAATLIFRVVVPTILGQVVAVNLTALPAVALAFTGCVAVGIALLPRTKAARFRAIAIALWIVASLLVALIGRNFVAMFGSVRHFTVFGGERYFFVGSLLLVYLIGSGIASRIRTFNGIALATSAVFALAAFGNFSIPRFSDDRWNLEATQLANWARARANRQATRALVIPINPAGWSIQLPGCESTPAERQAARLTCPPNSKAD